VLLRREGWLVNRKKVHRIYVSEGLSLRHRKYLRKRRSQVRIVPTPATGPNQRWCMDFVHDSLADGKSIRILTVVDTFSREAVLLECGRRMSGKHVANALEKLSHGHEMASFINVDNGSEFISKALDDWAHWKGVKLDFSRPAKRPTIRSLKVSTTGFGMNVLIRQSLKVLMMPAIRSSNGDANITRIDRMDLWVIERPRNS
jgi:putative transposase